MSDNNDKYDEIFLYGAPTGTNSVNVAKELSDRIPLKELLRNWGVEKPVIAFTYLIEKCECGKRFGVYEQDEELK